MQRKRIILLCILVLALSFPTLPRAQISDAEIVHCLNTTNGHPMTLDNTPWHLTQAQAINPTFQERLWLRSHHKLIVGRPLGWHTTWIAFVDASQPSPVAYETLRQGGMRAFGASLVPKAVQNAFEICGITWGGHWDGKFAYLQNQVSPPPPKIDLGQNLLPPLIVWED